eukprot:TRINITY_DN31251_c0_g1_i1.p1 TRINITY_DN31251_c0_g1~~TRINITY_DN31251_c0_g1_i1.p1  ORF type:complete len:148 (-),score=48.23 TRINITY_DN31251_c0_g1_i1:6-449(-)
MKITLLVLALFAFYANAVSYNACQGVSGTYTVSEANPSVITVGDFMYVDLSGQFNVSVYGGDLQLRLTNSDTAQLAFEVQGIDLCNTGAKGHNICGLPASTPLVLEPEIFWSPFFPKGNYDLSILAYSIDSNGNRETSFCGDLIFTF